jgi:hypothetical protein
VAGGAANVAPAVPTSAVEPKDPAALSRAAVIWVYLSLAASIFSAVDAIVELVSGAPDTPSVAVTLLTGLSALATLTALVGCCVVVLKWVYRVNLNAKVLAPDKTISPGWAVGWYFVPFAALWKPYQAIRETWQISANPKAWRSAPYPVLLRQWWALWIISNILSNVSFRLSIEHDLPGAATIGQACDLLSSLIDVPADLVFVLVITRLTALQIGALSGRSFD